MPSILTMQAAKFWVGLIGAMFTAFIASVPDAPAWVKAASAIAAAAGVYLTPNKQVTIDEIPTDEWVARNG